MKRLFGGCALLIAALTAGAQEHAHNSYSVRIAITLSPKAAATLKRLHEGIVVSTEDTGDPKPFAKKYADQVGALVLGRWKTEIPGRDATVTAPGARVNRKRVPWVEGPMQFYASAYSARRSGPDNILGCDFFQGPLSHAVSQTVALHCSLLTEKIEPRQIQ